METRTQTNATAAAYMREHRAAWRGAGFAPMSAMVYESDRPKIVAFADVTKYETLLALVIEGDSEAIDLAATRNVPKMPTYDMVTDVLERSEKMSETTGLKRSATEVNALLLAVRRYMAKFNKVKGAWDEDMANDLLRAKYVCYGNLAVSTFKLADAVSHSSPLVGEDGDD
tara:strand:+ start:1619 stop:2131 length:513 start_codon:yes stop_codon:yes gene_type:complete